MPLLPHNARYRKHTQTITKVLFIPYSYELLSIGEDGFVIIWDYRNDLQQETLKLEGSLTDANISKSGNLVVILSDRPCVYK